jgi:hypothetical protein
MSRSVASAARAIQVNPVASGFPVGKPKAARLALDCPDGATVGKTSIQPGDSTLALIDEAFVYLGWKHDYVASVIGVSAPLFSRAMRGVDGKKFDATWLSKLPSEFWPAFVHVASKKHHVTEASRQQVILDAICGHLGTMKTLVQTVVSA